MKWSATRPDKQQERRDYIAARWSQLDEVYTSWTEEALKYLLAVNTAGMAGALSFIGAMPQLRPLFWPKAVLLIFACGVVSVGLYHLARHHRTRWLYRCWRDAVRRYKTDEIDWDTLLDGDEKRTYRFTVPLGLLSHGALVLFVGGLAVAGWNFEDITRPPPQESKQNERTQTTVAPAGTAGSRTGPARAGHQSMAAKRAGEGKGNPKSANTGAGREAAKP